MDINAEGSLSENGNMYSFKRVRIRIPSNKPRKYIDFLVLHEGNYERYVLFVSLIKSFFLILLQTLMSVFLIVYLLNMPITVMVIPTAPTPKDHFTARVTPDTLETEFCVLVILLVILCGMFI